MDGNGKMTVNVPASVSTEGDALLLMRGYLDHECGHARWTDFNAPSTSFDPLTRTLANIFEDVRIEALMADAFEGARENLHGTAAKLFGGDEWKSRADNINAAEVVVAWLLWHVRTPACPEMEHGRDMLRGVADAYAPGLADNMLRALSGYALDSTESCWQAARCCSSMMKNYGGRNERLSGQSKADRERTEQAVDELAGGSRKLKDKITRKIEKEANPMSGAGMGGSSRSFGEEHAAKGQARLPTLTHGMASIVNDALDKDNPEQGASCGGVDASSSISPESCLSSGVAHEETDDERIKSGIVRSRLGRRLASLLQTQGAVRRGGARQGRRIDARSLWKAGAKDGRVFERSSQGAAANASVLVLMDQSGSMRSVYNEQGRCIGSPEPGDRPIDFANAACSGLLDALRSVKGVSAGMCAFSNQYSVTCPIGSGPRRGVRLAAEASGGTAIGRAIIDCTGMFPPDARRKIIVVLTDGFEGNEVDGAVAQAAELGVEVAGVGIGAASPIASVVPVSRIAAEPGDIPDALCGVLRDLLVQGSR